MTKSLRVLEICEEKRKHRLAVNLLFIIAEYSKGRLMRSKAEMFSHWSYKDSLH